MNYENVEIGKQYKVASSFNTSMLQEGEIVTVTEKLINTTRDNPFCKVITAKGMCLYIPPIRLEEMEE